MPKPFIKRLVFEFFEALDYICIEYKQNISDRSVSEEVLSSLQIDCIYFSCMQHERWVKKFTIHTVVYIFYNNKQKKVKDSFRKEQVTDFQKMPKKRENKRICSRQYLVVQSQQQKHWKKVWSLLRLNKKTPKRCRSGYLLSTLNRYDYHNFFKCFCCWLWTAKRLTGCILAKPKIILLVFTIIK